MPLCGRRYYINKTIDKVNNMNGGLGFLVNSSVNSANETEMYFRMTFTYDTCEFFPWDSAVLPQSMCLTCGPVCLSLTLPRFPR